MNNVIKRVYYLITCQNALPLSIGGAFSSDAVKEVFLNREGQAIIPGSSLAGALRALYIEQRLLLGDNKNKAISAAGDLFGSFESHGQSRLVVEDATIDLLGEIQERMHVKLKDRVAVHGALYKEQLISPGHRFTIKLELSLYATDNAIELESAIESIVLGLYQGDVYLGGNKNRGYGRIEVLTAHRRSFNIRLQNDYMSWLAFDNDQVSQYEFWDVSCKKNEAPQYLKAIGVEFKLKSPLMIHIGTEAHSNMGNDTSSKSNERHPYKVVVNEVDNQGIQQVEKIALPGSSVAGVFRHHFEKSLYLKSDPHVLDKWFGKAKESDCEENQGDTGRQSIVIFDDLYLTPDIRPLTRNKIDRFTGATVTGALFIDKAQWPNLHDTVTLSIKHRPFETQEEEQLFKKCLAETLYDLELGLVSFGSGWSIGRGRVTAVMPQDQTVYDFMKAISGEVTL